VQPGDLQARYDRMRGLIEDAPRWHGRPIAEVFAHHVRGVGKNDWSAALLVTLDFLIAGANTPAEKFDAPFSLAEAEQLPPLDHKIAWAGYAIACVVANEIAQEPQIAEPPRDPLAA
jgi:hypothetical protein